MAYAIKNLAVSLASVGFAVGAIQVQAAPVASLFNSAPTATLLTDDSAELITDVDTDGRVSVSDVVVMIVGINTVGGTPIGSGTGFNEVTAILAAKVVTATDVDLGPLGPDDDFGSQNIDLWQFTLAPLSGSDTGIFDWSSVTGCGAANNGLNIACVFEDSTQDYTRIGTIAGGISSATGGAFRLRLTMEAANADFFSITFPQRLSAFGTIAPGIAVNNSSLALDFTIASQIWPGLVIVPNVTGNGNFGASLTGDWPVFDPVEFRLTAQHVPEPATLALVGVSLGGLGFSRRKK